MKRVKLIVAYDGTNYCGWQIQANGITVEAVLNKALSELLREPVAVIGASRTDSGVHAEGNVAVFDTDNRMPGDKICFALNQRLPEDIRILQSEEVADGWHPRRQNCTKTYEYRIWNRKMDMPTLRLYSHFCYYPLDVEKMKEAAAYLVGEHDFKSFCTARSQVDETVRTIYSLDVEKQGDMVTIRISGNGFLYNMVRIIAGTLMRVGDGSYTPEYVEEILDARTRQAAGPKASAKGLTLVSLEYETQLQSVITGENQYWKYSLYQSEIIPKKKAYITIDRCAEEMYDRVLTRVTHQAVRNGAKQIYVHDKERKDRIAEGKAYGFYTFQHVYDMVTMTKQVTSVTKKSKVVMQPLIKAEIPQYCELYNEIFFQVPQSATLTVQELEERLDSGHEHICFLKSKDELVGVVMLIEKNTKELEIDGIGILHTCRGRGLAAWAFAEIEGYAAEKGLDKMTLLVVNINQPAYFLYQKLGFKVDQEKSAWYMAEK